MIIVICQSLCHSNWRRFRRKLLCVSALICGRQCVYSILQKSVAKSGLLENAIDARMRIKTITYSDVLTKALPVLLARTFAHHYRRRSRPCV